MTLTQTLTQAMAQDRLPCWEDVLRFVDQDWTTRTMLRLQRDRVLPVPVVEQLPPAPALLLPPSWRGLPGHAPVLPQHRGLHYRLEWITSGELLRHGPADTVHNVFLGNCAMGITQAEWNAGLLRLEPPVLLALPAKEVTKPDKVSGSYLLTVEDDLSLLSLVMNFHAKPLKWPRDLHGTHVVCKPAGFRDLEHDRELKSGPKPTIAPWPSTRNGP